MSAYAEADHWHLVTYGLTELFAKESDEPEISGFGYELTMRVPRTGEDGPPDWPFELLAKFAGAARTGHDFAVGHRLQANGSFEFYELVGITPDELAEMQASSSTAAVVDRLAASNPLLITDPTRQGR